MQFSDGIAAWAALAATTLALSATGVSAQVFGNDNFYLKGFGGLTVPQDDDFQLNERGGDAFADTGLDYSNGYTLGIAGGYTMTPNLALELEYAYRNADASFKGTDSGDRKTESNAFMLNALYNMTPMGPWQPYVGGGLGVADLNIEQIPGVDGGDFDSDYNFAYQLIGGVAYQLQSGWTLNGEVRYFGINDQDLENSELSFKSSYTTFDLLFGASYRF